MSPYIKIAIVLAVLAGAFTSGYQVASWKADADKLVVAKDHQQAMQAQELAVNVLSGKLSTANDRHAAELKKAQNETNLLRTAFATGAGSLHIAATCVDASHGPQATAGTGVDSGAGAELDQAARRAYFALRDGIDTASGQLAACQEQLKLRGAQ